jgi:hypothetical protein
MEILKKLISFIISLFKKTEIKREVPPPVVPVKKKVKRKGMLKAKNDSPRIKKELVLLETKNKELYDLAIDLYKYVRDEFGKDVILTMIFRTTEEQEYLYRHSEKYAKKPFKSPHQFFHALDIRSFIYTKEERDKMVDYLNSKYNKENYYKWTAKVHEVGDNGMHFHIQLVKA